MCSMWIIRGKHIQCGVCLILVKKRRRRKRRTALAFLEVAAFFGVAVFLVEPLEGVALVFLFDSAVWVLSETSPASLLAAARVFNC